MTSFRSLLYFVLFIFISLIAFVLLLPFLLLPKKWSLWIPILWTRFHTTLLRCTTGLHHEILGKENISDSPVIYAIKHQSAWETLILPHILKNPAFVLKQELLYIPFFGWYLAKYKMLPIDRDLGSKSLLNMIKKGTDIVKEGRSIVIFPEGTRTAPGEKHPYHSGVYLLYSKLGIPVVPVSHNSGFFWPKKAFKKHPGTITMTFHKAIAPGLDRKTFMATLENTIETACHALEKKRKDTPTPC